MAVPQGSQPDPDFVQAGADWVRVQEESLEEYEANEPSSGKRATDGRPAKRGFLGGTLLLTMNWVTVMASAIVAAALFVVCDFYDPWWGSLPTKQYHIGMAVGVVVGYFFLRKVIHEVFSGEDYSRPSVGGLLFTAVCYAPLLAGVVMAGITFHTPSFLNRRIGSTVLRVPWEYLAERSPTRTADVVVVSVCWPQVTLPAKSSRCADRDRATISISKDMPSIGFGRTGPVWPETGSYRDFTAFNFKHGGLDLRGKVQGRREADWAAVKPRILGLVASWRR